MPLTATGPVPSMETVWPLRVSEVPPSPGGPLVLLYSADLDATVAAVEAAGGEVVEPPYAFPGGRRFHFRDPAGNELGVWAEQ